MAPTLTHLIGDDGGKSTVVANSAMDFAIRELERLQDGWCGTDSLAPPRQVLRNLHALMSVIPAKAKAPEIEVEEDTGFVTLRWWRPGDDTALALIVRGRGPVLAVKTTMGEETRVSSLAFDVVREGDALARYLTNDPAIIAALANP